MTVFEPHWLRPSVRVSKSSNYTCIRHYTALTSLYTYQVNLCMFCCKFCFRDKLPGQLRMKLWQKLSFHALWKIQNTSFNNPNYRLSNEDTVDSSEVSFKLYEKYKINSMNWLIEFSVVCPEFTKKIDKKLFLFWLALVPIPNCFIKQYCESCMETWTVPQLRQDLIFLQLLVRLFSRQRQFF